jgi:hypothetical protein
VLQQCGNDLTRENILKQATSLKNQRLKMYLPGIVLNNSAENYAAYSGLRMAKFEDGTWKLLDSDNVPTQPANAH